MVDCLEPGRRGITISVIILGGALLTVLFAYLAFGDSNDDENIRTLRMVAIVNRHGDRSPTELYPNDPHINYQWSGGLGSLSHKGFQQMYNLGKNLRSRYYRLLPSNGLYTKEKMYILSSAAERCLMSTESFLAGFMPPLENNNPLPVLWQPIPINSIPRDKDNLLAQKRSCPKYDEALKKLYTTPTKDLKDLYEKNDGLFKLLTKNTGKNISTVLDVEFLYNTLEIEEKAGLELPDWTEGIYPEKLLLLAEKSLDILTETTYMKRAKGGVLLTEIIDKMFIIKNNINNVYKRNIYIYSGHDVTIINILKVLNIVNQTSKKPDLAATIVFELHHSYVYDDDYEIKIVYYFNSDDKFPKDINIPNCDKPCSLTNFNNIMKNMLVKNYDELCEIV